ncbi:T9SS type A sorting domain-containing protein [Chitinophaga sp. XS-30]|uniref:T9SS type A sorting domain-containing protein n=1 Tax=Chitinophaga sp. XS-30 TaxID=2604421 RepID=UPI0011DD4360|nr:T9SS type A sorting domain-containing protein [Chitinophaga sp. XS-30]QEH43511.1 T9SS type A sorting domain-containing protein [Chitinophaga sp. XS-30]
MNHYSTKLLLPAIMLAMAWLPARSQLVLVRQAVASGGGSGPAGAVNFDFTIGETMVTTLSGGIMLTQGFQQPEVLPPVTQGASPILDFMLFPNPAVTTVKMEFDLLTEATVVYMIVNTAGQVIFQDIKPFGPGKVTIPTPVDRLAAGIYTVIIKVNGHVRTEKLIVQ